MHVVATLATTLESFDETAQADYKAKLANAAGAGVRETDVELDIAPASITVSATILTSNTEIADRAISGVAFAIESSLDSFLGFPVTSTPSLPTRAFVIVPAPRAASTPSPPSPFLTTSTPDSSSSGGLIFAVVGVVAGLGVCVLWWCRRRHRQPEPAKRAEPGKPAKSAEPAKPVEPEKPAKPAEPSEPAKSAEPAKPLTSVGLRRQSEPVNASRRGEALEAEKSFDPERSTSLPSPQPIGQWTLCSKAPLSSLDRIALYIWMATALYK